MPPERLDTVYDPPVFVEPGGPLRLDINVADSAAWTRLGGIGPVLARRIVKYRDARGGFRSVDDLSAVYGLKPEVLDALRPQLFVNGLTAPGSRDTARELPARTAIPRLDLNTATAESLRQLPGIGPVLSERIVKYRDAIGGFASAEQLAQVYQLPPETYLAILPYVHVDPATRPARPQPAAAPEAAPLAAAQRSRGLGEAERPSLAPVDLNQADSAALVQIPGIGEKLAPRIVKYRSLLGYYASPDQVRFVYGMTEENFLRARPLLRAAAPPERRDLNSAPARLISAVLTMNKPLADALIAERKRLGRFGSWDEVRMVSGMAPESVQLLQAYFKL